MLLEPPPIETPAPKDDSPLVQQWNNRVSAAKSRYEKAFRRMDDCAWLARTGRPRASSLTEYGPLTFNICGRHVNQKTAALYAKNPTMRWKRRRKLEWGVWDGKIASLQAAMMAVQARDLSAAGVIADAEKGRAAIKLAESVGRTLSALVEYQHDAAVPSFKQQMKMLVRRAVTVGVGYVDVDFVRRTEPARDPLVRVDQVSVEVANLQGRIEALRRGDIPEGSAEAEQLQAHLASVQSQPDLIAHEGLIYGFPSPATIIPSPSTLSLVGWVGTDWICKERMLTPEQVHSYYGVYLDQANTTRMYTSTGYVQHGGVGGASGSDIENRFVLVREIWDRASGVVMTIADGHSGWLAPPAPPRVRLRQFFNIFALTFNADVVDRCGISPQRAAAGDADDDDEDSSLFPLSDVWLIRHMQEAVNFKVNARQIHVQAILPRFIAGLPSMAEEDVRKIGDAAPWSVTQLKGMPPDGDVRKLIALVPIPGIDPNVYDVGPELQQVMLTVGTQEANLGPAGGATATETSIAEASRSSSMASDINDLDALLGAVAEAEAEILLANASPEYVKRIIGPGAAWPDLARQEIADQVTLEVEAGSSGLPNRAQQAAMFERLLPALQIVPGISPDWMARKLVEVLDAGVDIDEAVIDGTPSLMAMNAMAKAGPAAPPADPTKDPAAQGPEGADKQPRPPGSAPGPQPGFPSPTMTAVPTGQFPGSVSV